MGFLLGANIKDATWLNFDIAAAQANRIQIENAHQQATYELQERLAVAQTEAEIRQIQREQSMLDAQYQYDVAALNQDLEHRDFAFRTRMTIFAIFGGALSLAIVLGTFLWTGSKVLASISFDPTPTPDYISPVAKKTVNRPARESHERWADPNYRRRMKAAAKNQERKERDQQKEAELLAARMANTSDPAKISGDKRDKLPLAGD